MSSGPYLEKGTSTISRLTVLEYGNVQLYSTLMGESRMMLPVTSGSDDSFSEYLTWVKFFCRDRKNNVYGQEIPTYNKQTWPLLAHLEWFAPTVAIVLLRCPDEVVLLAVDGRFVSAARSVWQMQRSQLCLVIVKEFLQCSDFDVILAAHNSHFRVWKTNQEDNWEFKTFAKRATKVDILDTKYNLGCPNTTCSLSILI